MRDRQMHCKTCQGETLFQVPPCDDAHDDDCPELICTGCGAAVLIAPITMRVWLRPPGAIAPQQRRAA